MRAKNGSLEYDYDSTTNSFRSITLNGQELSTLMDSVLSASNITIGNPFDKDSKNILFAPLIGKICYSVFDAIKIIKDRNQAATLSSNFFEYFTPCWRKLLAQGRDVLGISYWFRILSICRQWENTNRPTKIHKGTPYYFLAENYLLLGDRDLAFIYLYNAINEDIKLGKLVPSLNYPVTSPAYLTATLNGNPNNQMYPLIKELRNMLEDYVNKFNKYFRRMKRKGDQPFSMNKFDNKFLENKSLADLAYFFVYNLIYLITIEKNVNKDLLQNKFARLKALDVIFNLCLIIDETLKKGHHNNQAKISYGIIWLCTKKNNWIAQNELELFWKKKNFEIASGLPNKIIPKVLAMNERNNKKVVRKEVFTLLLAYNLRNYGGHNIGQQSVLTTRYNRIIHNLIMSLFLSVEAL